MKFAGTTSLRQPAILKSRPLEMWQRLSPRGRWTLLWGISFVGYALCLEALLAHGLFSLGGGRGGGDVYAYWQAAQRSLAGHALYSQGVGGYAAYLYPPILAQLTAPFSGLSFDAFAWGWRLLELLALAAVLGWRGAGIAMLVWPPIITELDAGNVHLFVAAALAGMLRADGRWLIPVALTKFASLFAVPAGWISDRRGVLVGAGVSAIAALLSMALSPHDWWDYLGFLGQQTRPPPTWMDLSVLPLAVRLSIAAALALAAVRWRRLAVIATVVAYPVIWYASLSTLVALLVVPRVRPISIPPTAVTIAGLQR